MNIDNVKTDRLFPAASHKYIDIKTQIEQLLSQYNGIIKPSDFYNIIEQVGILKNLIPNNGYVPDELYETLLCIGELFDDQGLLLSLGAHCFAGATALRYYGSEKLKKEILPSVVSGRAILAFAATEKMSGSDVMAMQSTYQKDNDGFILNGEKCYITNATIADHYLIFASKNTKLYDRGISLFLVHKNSKGLAIENFKKSDVLCNSGIGKIKLNNVSVPSYCLVGKELEGAKIFHHCIKVERAFILIPHIGIMKRFFAICLSYAKNRKQFSKSLDNYQMINEKILEIYKQIVISNLLAKETVSNANALSSLEASLTKLTISDALFSTHQNAIKILGALGLLGESRISNKLTDSFASTIYSGSSEILKTILTTELSVMYNENIN